MANKLTRIQFDTGMKDFMPKTSFTDEDIRKSKSPGVKPSITIRRQKLAPYKPGQDPFKEEVESEFGVHLKEVGMLCQLEIKKILDLPKQGLE